MEGKLCVLKKKGDYFVITPKNKEHCKLVHDTIIEDQKNKELIKFYIESYDFGLNLAIQRPKNPSSLIA